MTNGIEIGNFKSKNATVKISNFGSRLMSSDRELSEPSKNGGYKKNFVMVPAIRGLPFCKPSMNFTKNEDCLPLETAKSRNNGRPISVSRL